MIIPNLLICHRIFCVEVGFCFRVLAVEFVPCLRDLVGKCTPESGFNPGIFNSE
jgi:hypothetical protein